MQALELIPQWADEFRAAFGREAGGLVHRYRTDDAETIIVALGSVLGTIKDTVDDLRARGVRIGVLGIACFRPWPQAAVRAALAHARRVVVLEKSLAVGIGGIVAANVRTALAGYATPVYAVIGGLGGRPITKASLERVFKEAMTDKLELNTFLDLDRAIVERVLARERDVRRSGPIAENVLKEVGTVAARIG
jgi:pyruvate ferredoxin oxidoreductase alpha subunit